MVVSGLRWNLIWNSGLRVQFDGLFFTEARPEELTPHVMVLLAQHLARHRLREPQLLEAIAHFLVVQEAQLNSKVGLPPTLPCSSPGHPQPPCQAQPLVRLDWLLLPAADNPARLSALSPRVPSLRTPSLVCPAPQHVCLVLWSSPGTLSAVLASLIPLLSLWARPTAVSPLLVLCLIM